MNTKNRSIIVLVFGFLSPFTIAIPALTATTCNGSLGPINIDTDLIVPAGQTCRLNGTQVDGSVYVEANARLFTSNNAFIDGTVKVGANASAELVQTTSDGAIELVDSRQLIVRNSLLDGGIKSTNTGTITLSDTSVDGEVESSQRTNLTATRVNSTSGFKTLNINSFKLFDSTLASGIFVDATVNRTEFCGNTLSGSAHFSRNAGVLQVGGAAAFQSCTGNPSGTNTVVGNLEILANTARSAIANNRIVGNLSCFGNSPAPVGGNNTVDGNKEGQCAAL